MESLNSHNSYVYMNFVLTGTVEMLHKNELNCISLLEVYTFYKYSAFRLLIRKDWREEK